MLIKVVDDKEELIRLEILRGDVIDVDTSLDSDNYYFRKISDNRGIAFGMYVGDNLVAGAYVSGDRNSLYIDYLFVDKKYQDTKLKLRLGRCLLTYIMNNKYIVEDRLGKKFSNCYLEARGDKAYDIFTGMGFVESGNIFGELKKRI